MNKLLIIFVGFALTLVLGFMFVWPKYQNLRNINLNIKEREAELKLREDYFAKVNEISSQLGNYQESLLKIASALPKDPQLASLFNFLQIKAGENGLIFENIKLEGVIESKKDKKFRDVKANMELSGSYESLKGFLSAVETSSRLIEITSLSLEPPTETREKASYNVEVLTRSY